MQLEAGQFTYHVYTNYGFYAVVPLETAACDDSNC